MDKLEELKRLNNITDDETVPVTIQDLVEALDILTNIVLGGEENG